jgi:hypothetical protein
MKPKKINLNDYERVQTIGELDGYSSIIIIPYMMDDGTQPAALFLRRGEKKNEIYDVDDIVWDKDVVISKRGTVEEYAKRVDWWYSNAANDPEYRAMINENFSKNQYDVKMAWGKAIAWLKRQTPSARKTHLHKFMWEWLSKGLGWTYNKEPKQRSYR